MGIGKGCMDSRGLGSVGWGIGGVGSRCRREGGGDISRIPL